MIIVTVLKSTGSLIISSDITIRSTERDEMVLVGGYSQESEEVYGTNSAILPMCVH